CYFHYFPVCRLRIGRCCSPGRFLRRDADRTHYLSTTNQFRWNRAPGEDLPDHAAQSLWSSRGDRHSNWLAKFSHHPGLLPAGCDCVFRLQTKRSRRTCEIAGDGERGRRSRTWNYRSRIRNPFNAHFKQLNVERFSFGMKQKHRRPFVTATFAMTVDGRVTTRNLTPVDFTSRDDKLHLFHQRALADAVLIGHTSLKRDNVRLGLHSELQKARIRRGQTPCPFRVIVSDKGEIDSRLKIFQSDISPIIIFSTKQMPRK